MISLQSKGVSRVFSPTSQFKSSSCNPRDSQESSPTAQLRSINLLALGLLYGEGPCCPPESVHGKQLLPRGTCRCQQLSAQHLSCKRGFHPEPADHALENLSARCSGRPSAPVAGVWTAASPPGEEKRQTTWSREGRTRSQHPPPPPHPPPPGKSQEGAERDSSFLKELNKDSSCASWSPGGHRKCCGRESGDCQRD